MENSINIRHYVPADRNEVLQVLDANIPQYFAAEERADFLHYLDNELEDYYVAEANGEIVGAGGINYFPEEGNARISWDFIKPSYQGKGIGAALVKHRLAVMRSHKSIKRAIVRTTQLVYKFYEKQGFHLKHQEKDFWALGFDLYVLDRDI